MSYKKAARGGAWMEFDHFPDVRQLRTFEAIARLGSLVAASEALHISQPAVTYLAMRLESDLGTTVFERTARGTRLTSKGKLLAVRTNRFFQQLGTALAGLIGASRSRNGSDVILSRLTKLHCKTLLTVWDCGQIRIAAQRLGIREQAVKRTLRALEELCEVSLFEHSLMRGDLRDNVREFARRLALAGKEIEAVHHEFGSVSRADARSLKIGTLVLAPRRIVAESTEAWAKMFPDRSIEIIEGSFEDLVVLLRAGKIDAIFGALRAPPPFEDLAEEQLLPDPYVLACRNGHPLSVVKMLGAKHLSDAQFIMPTAGLRREVMLKLFKKLRIAPSHQTHTNWLPSIIALLQMSDRLAILSRSHLEEDRGNNLRQLDIRVPYQGRFVGITTRREWLPTSVQLEFLQRVREVVASRRI
jgi:LysR family transcriptional regulator of gallate degradation